MLPAQAAGGVHALEGAVQNGAIEELQEVVRGLARGSLPGEGGGEGRRGQAEGKGQAGEAIAGEGQNSASGTAWPEAGRKIKQGLAALAPPGGIGIRIRIKIKIKIRSKIKIKIKIKIRREHHLTLTLSPPIGWER